MTRATPAAITSILEAYPDADIMRHGDGWRIIVADRENDRATQARLLKVFVALRDGLDGYHGEIEPGLPGAIILTERATPANVQDIADMIEGMAHYFAIDPDAAAQEIESRMNGTQPSDLMRRAIELARERAAKDTPCN